MSRDTAAAGFTIVELLVVIAIAAILLAAAAPNFSSFVAQQRVRATTSELQHDLALARVQAVEGQQQVFLDFTVANGVTTGWQLAADADGNGTVASTEIIKTSDTLPTALKICTNSGGAVPSRLTFLPNGRIAELANGSVTLTGLRVSAGTDAFRTLYFGPTGRVNIVDKSQDSGASACS
ncbi:MAG: GspH/FimT family pseudopilin [Rhodocyclaceae bacterium]|nr:GspH/FimT family pseudopilin [Rhodocyclaceae bacterium]MBX3667419.1 GspH/FimT family pseudopilin [Rhodocyclaceae bacterium]